MDPMGLCELSPVTTTATYIYSPPDPGAVQSTLGPESAPLLAPIAPAVTAVVTDILSVLSISNSDPEKPPLVSAYDNTTKGRSITNFTTDVSADEAGATLESNGFSSSVSADGDVTPILSSVSV
jgi:hypothetical protein